MSEPKPLASLNGSLLARKGGAKPAMRSPMMQPFVPLGTVVADTEQLDDLGWNDMGDPQEDRHHADILPLTPSPINLAAEAEARVEDELAAEQLAKNARRIASGQPLHDASPKPQVVRQREEIAQKLVTAVPQTASAEPRNDATTKPAAKRKSRPTRNDGRRAAFTLRLDTDRHLKLRLACTVRNRSAQQIVTEALDNLLNAMPEIESLAAQVKRH
ncbi:hypothetical protein MB02_01030 [Croceicoccus estronivorus]|uniref:hypothetical protein n=1 Tax=Croceicoccus estronivorus TaxID=1172626 RepID=UPI00083026AF|nr:hypothetical protein [Croceicoccus estronivorus]OCC25288.1 hypothetical protein MB02_01030 [Croceicoccus estronivorus]